MSTVAMEQRKKIHPHKFTLWVGIGSLLMMFAGLTSAYIVKRNLGVDFDDPASHDDWYSTVAIILSSATIYMAGKMFEKREMRKYRSLVLATIVLGVLFIVFSGARFSAVMGKANYTYSKCILLIYVCNR